MKYRDPLKNSITRLTYCSVVALTYAMWFVDQAPAGIMTFDSNNIVTSWSSDTAGETYYFYKGSYNDNATIITQFTGGLSTTVETEFVTDLGSTVASPALPMYAFDTEPANGTTARYHIGIYEGTGGDVGAWGAASNIKTSTTETTRTFAGETRDLYWASTTEPSSGAVPEPSTAIAMGLLGVVGFAGSRRRRRQVSAA